MSEIVREEWECEVYENLEAMSVDAPKHEVHAPGVDAECPRCTDEVELARALRDMPLLDEQACSSRLA